MTVVGTAVCLALWTAAAYRLVVVARYPTRLRGLLAITTAAMAATATTHFARPVIDSALHIPNVASLAARLALILSLTSLRLWAATVEQPDGRLSRTRVTVAAVAAGVTTAAWALSPLHDATVTDHAQLEQTPALLVYTLGLYAFFAWVALDLGVFAARRVRALRWHDPPASVALASITVAAVSGTVVMLAFSIHVALNASGRPSSVGATVGHALMPLTLVILGLGLLTVPIARSLTAARDLVRVTPQWRNAPDAVRLGRSGFLSPDTVLTRRLIEIHDSGQVGRPPRDQLDEQRLNSAQPSARADLIGRVLSPFPVLLALICWTAAVTSPDLAAAARWSALAAGLIVGVPFIALILLRATGRVTDRQVAHRSQRHLLLAIALVSTAAAA
ncbi:MAG: hypothetical protein ACRCXL_06990, partial [Dermatophilaceae bacterium]